MPSSSHSPALLVAAAASGAAGMIHAAAAGSHAELATLATLFGVAAVLQVGWAVAALLRESRVLLGAGAALQIGALGVWLASRTVGIGFIEGLEAGPTLGFQDGLVVAFEVLAVVAIGAASFRPASTRRLAPLVPALAGAMLVAAVPAMATPHDHDAHDHGDPVQLASAAGAHDDHAAHGDDAAGHDDHATHDDGHDDHGTPASDTDPDAPAPDVPYPASFVSWLDTAETPDERAAAETLLVETTEAMKAFPDEAAVQAAGYVSIGDGATGWEHYIHVGRIADPAVLDPNGIESIVLRVNPDGTKQVASAMYLLPFGTSMAEAPDIAGDLTPWHDHQNLCWDGVSVVGTTDATGRCERGSFRPTQPMIHVWVQDHECGPFAGIEGSHGAGCSHDHG